MADTSKYDLFLNEIGSLEKAVQKFVSNNVELEEEKLSLITRVNKLQKENEILVLKIKDLEKQISVAEDVKTSAGKTNLDLTERENLKNQIDDLISRIDYHIRS